MKRSKSFSEEGTPNMGSVRLISQHDYPSYELYNPPGHIDHWVKEAVKTLYPEYREAARNYTRRNEGVKGLYFTLSKYGARRILKSEVLNTPEKKHCYVKALEHARKAFQLPTKIHPIEDYEVGAYMRPDTSAGISFPGLTKAQAGAELYYTSKMLKHKMKMGAKPFDPRRYNMPPCKAASRGAMSTIDKPKTRLIWLYPAEILAVEGMYAPKLYEAYSNWNDSPMLTGQRVDRVCNQFLSQLDDDSSITGIDFSAFDTSIPAFIIYDAFQILHDNIDWDTWKGKKVPDSHKRKWSNVWKGLIHYFINTPILMPDGKMYRKNHGVPSGSWFTQLIDSVCNFIIITYLSLKQGCNVLKLKVLGDDSGLITRKGDFDLNQATIDALEDFLMTINANKSEQTDLATDVKLLGFTYPKGIRTKPTEELFLMALLPDFPVRSLEMSWSRVIGIYLAAGKNDEKFCRFINWYESGYDCPKFGFFSKDTARMLENITRCKDSGRAWNLEGDTKLKWHRAFQL